MSAGRAMPAYPHARHDCAGCREHDADVELLDDQGRPRRPRHELCHGCLGQLAATLALTGLGPDPSQVVALRLRPAHGRRS